MIWAGLAGASAKEPGLGALGSLPGAPSRGSNRGDGLAGSSAREAPSATLHASEEGPLPDLSSVAIGAGGPRCWPAPGRSSLRPRDEGGPRGIPRGPFAHGS